MSDSVHLAEWTLTIVGQIGQKLDGPCLDLVALSNQTATLGQHEAEHTNGVGVRVNGFAPTQRMR